MHCTQLSFIRLVGGISVGVQGKQLDKGRQLEDTVNLHKLWLFQTIGFIVRTTTLRVCSRLSNHITSQVWIVGTVVCDIMIAMCMTYFVGFSKFHPFDFSEPLNHTPCLLWQLSRFDTTIKQSKIILKKIIRLTIGTGSLTGI